jgi:peptide/nickel transport system substrate-binding protein
MRIKRTALGILALLASGGLLSLSPAHAAGTITAAQGSDVLTLDPTMDTSLIGMNVMTNVFDQLTTISPRGEILPMLSTAWEGSADARTWTFTVRSDAKFHDGSPVTLDDVVWSYQKIIDDQRSPVRVYLTKVEKVEKVEPDKVRFTLNDPYGPFARQTSLISIVPRKAYEAAGPAKFSQAPVGSGPYRVARWLKDDRVELEKNPTYWGGAPSVDTIVFKPLASEAARAAALSSGQIDIASLPPASVDRLGSDKSIGIKRIDSFRVIYVGADTNNPVLADPRIRQAIDAAINRDAIATRLLKGLGKPAAQMVTPVTFGFDETIQPTRYDPDRAKALLKEAGYTGEKIVFQFPNNRFALGDQVAQAVGGYLTAVGLNVELQGMEYAAMFPLWANRKLNGLHLWAFGPSVMDADLVLGYLYAKGGTGYWIDPEVERLIGEQRAEPDPAKRKTLISQIWRRSREQLPYIPLYGEVQAYGIREGVGWQPRPDERMLFGAATRN